MTNKFSRQTFALHMPVIRAIFSHIEVDVIQGEGLEKRKTLHVLGLEKEFGLLKLKRAMELITTWLEDTDFSVRSLEFLKSEDSHWTSLLKILNDKIIEYGNDVPVIEISLTPNGVLMRQVPNEILTCEITEDGMKLKILEIILRNQGEFVSTKDICRWVESKNEDSVRKQIGQLNNLITSRLQLPANFSLLDSKPVSGYRIHPIYNLVRIKNK